MKRGREPATVLRPFFMLAGRWFGDAERGCGRALSRASGDALLRARPSCSGPRAHLRTGGGSDQRARQERQTPSRPLRTRSFAAASFAGAISCRGETEHQSLLPDIRRRGIALAPEASREMPPKNTTSSATGTSGAMGNNGHTVRSGAAGCFIVSSMG